MKIITLCGSTRNKLIFEEWNARLTLEGNVVFSCGVWVHMGHDVSDEQKRMLDHIHKIKIDMSDEIFVIDENVRVGSSTQNEIEYAKLIGKTVRFMSQEVLND